MEARFSLDAMGNAREWPAIALENSAGATKKTKHGEGVNARFICPVKEAYGIPMTNKLQNLGEQSNGLACPTQRSRCSASLLDSSHLVIRGKGRTYTASEITENKSRQ